METLGTRDYEAEVLALMKAMQLNGKAVLLYKARELAADYPARQATILEFPRPKHKSVTPQTP